VLVVVEVALALVLFVASALLIRWFVAMRAVDPGYTTHNILTMEMSLNQPRYTKTAAVAQLASTG
jgi:putative ABC transport system permease protein